MLYVGVHVSCRLVYVRRHVDETTTSGGRREEDTRQLLFGWGDDRPVPLSCRTWVGVARAVEYTSARPCSD